MGKKPLYIFGVRYAGPKGLRRSPGSNWLANCVARQMAGKKFGSRAAVRAGFSATASSCSGTRGKG
ncbi:unnamed protein product [marine sediment metagenome]|uniref:Uncharacterized protein n=1 Tax=marine sediment metagenome TaxID=412755 RepID=X1G195_9ZZZZ